MQTLNEQLADFSRALVQTAAIVGVERTTQLLKGWSAARRSASMPKRFYREVSQSPMH